MTTTPTAKLTGTELLEAIKANPEMDRPEIIAHCGYTNPTEFYEALLDSKGVDLEKFETMMELGVTAYE